MLFVEPPHRWRAWNKTIWDCESTVDQPSSRDRSCGGEPGAAPGTVSTNRTCQNWFQVNRNFFLILLGRVSGLLAWRKFSVFSRFSIMVLTDANKSLTNRGPTPFGRGSFPLTRVFCKAQSSRARSLLAPAKTGQPERARQGSAIRLSPMRPVFAVRRIFRQYRIANRNIVFRSISPTGVLSVRSDTQETQMRGRACKSAPFCLVTI